MSIDTPDGPPSRQVSKSGLPTEPACLEGPRGESHQLVDGVRRLQEEAVELRGDMVGVEVTTKSFRGGV